MSTLSRRTWMAGLLVCTSMAMSDPVSAQTGKCCLPDGRGCRNVTQIQCDAFGGVFLDGQTCANPDDTCDGPVSGACCVEGVCNFVLSTACNGSFFPGSACSPTICGGPITGSCCENFQCRITVAINCPNGVFTANQGCAANPCGTPPMGACCRGGVCLTTLRDECFAGGDGSEWFQEQACTPTLCRLGGCCTGPFSCVIVTQTGCEQGTWIADGTCAPAFCVQARGTCCLASGACVVTTDTDCTNGTFVFEAVCTPETCASIVGACCHGTACSVTTSAACGAGFQGPGSSCGPAGNPTTCCPANFNGEAGVTVQDIFDFLAAYFSNDPRADFNGGGGVTVQDIFDFLAAYFGGCA